MKCNFINCEGGIASHSLSGSIIVKNCLFEFCTDIIRTKRNSEITNCQFIACYDKLIDASWEGDVKIEFCQFVNTSWTKPTDSVYDTINGNSCISFSRDKKGYASNLNHCVFDGVETNEGFLISAPHQLYNPKAKTVAFIENCDFRNCTTKRESEKIIKEFSTYDSLFKKGQQFKAISISECKGLDKINCEKSEADVVIKKNQTASGETIGSTLTTTGKVAVGGLGYAIGGPIGLAFAVGKMGKKIIKEKTEIE